MSWRRRLRLVLGLLATLAGALAGRFVFAYQDMIDRSSGEAPGHGPLLYALLGALPGLCLVAVAVWGRDDE
jgi:hypothetical protein